MNYGDTFLNAINHATAQNLRAEQSVRVASVREINQALATVKRTAERCGDSVQFIEHGEGK